MGQEQGKPEANSVGVMGARRSLDQQDLTRAFTGELFFASEDIFPLLGFAIGLRLAILDHLHHRPRRGQRHVRKSPSLT